jgi:hypothetical protein
LRQEGGFYKRTNVRYVCAMYSVNRSVAIVRLKSPYIKWANSCSDDGREYSREYFEKACTALLMPTYVTEKEARAYMTKIWEKIFEERLANWNTDETLWPQNRTQKMFWKWFGVEFYLRVFDAEGAPIKKSA